MNDVLVVLTNWKRPQNMPKIIAAWKGQSSPPKHVVVVDNSPYYRDGSVTEGYPNHKLHGADDVWRMTRNHGCPCHFVPAWMYCDCQYVLFADDDLLPDKDALAFALSKARDLGDNFATIGMIARNFRMDQPSGRRYVYGNAPDGKVDCTNRVHLVQHKHLASILYLRHDMVQAFGKEAELLVGIHDDLLMCLSIQRAFRQPSYAFSQEINAECKLVKEELGSNDEYSIYRRPQHLAERNRFVDMAFELGWRSLR